MHKRIFIIHMQSQEENWYWKNWLIVFLSVIQRIIIFLSAIQRIIIFLSAIQRALFFLSVSQRAIEFSFQKHYSAIASISWYEAHNFLKYFDYFCYLYVQNF